jgi:hypothetical protein
MDKFHKGQRVTVQTLAGAVVRLVWEDYGDAVAVCSERQYEALSRGWKAPIPIGFPKNGVSPATE